MSLVLLADDSPHAQRIGERILREEGFEVVTVTDGETALIRLEDAAPDVILADVLLPRRSGYEVCSHVKNHPRFGHARVILTAGALEPLDEQEARRVGADAVLRKPFEASVVLATLKPLLGAMPAPSSRPAPPAEAPKPEATPVLRAAEGAPAAPAQVPEIDPERVRAAVTLALDASLPALVDEITAKVLIALKE